jgi:hypothetical protein
MKLSYDVLWFDDSRDFLGSLDLDPLNEAINSWGFLLELKPVETPDEFMAEQPFEKYDLIVVDYNLGDQEPHGEEFIRRVQDQQVYTEVIFYSANPSSDLWAGIQERKLEGVFVANRQGILDKITRVARQSVRKVLDLNNMRGMVMAEVGDMDRLLDSILTEGLGHLSQEEQAAIFARFHEASLEQAEQQLAKIKGFGDNPSAEALCGLCDSNKRWANFNRLRKKHAALNGMTMGDYAQDVLSPRNHLAHGVASETETGHMFKFNGKDYLFDEATSLKLRKVILDYKQKFQDARERVGASSEEIPQPIG